MEISILKWVDATFHSQTWLNYLMKYITYIGEFGLGAIITALVLLLVPKTRRSGIGAAIALILNVLIVNVILKTAVNRPRPWTEFPEIEQFYESVGVRLPTDSSFPSGHTAACFSVAVFLVFRYRLKGLPALAVAILVALSRIYLCVHYPTDVLGGLLIGSACGAAGYFISLYILKFFDKRRAAKQNIDFSTMTKEQIAEFMQDKGLDFNVEILKVLYSTDKTKRYILLKSEKDFVTFEYEVLNFYSEEERKYLNSNAVPAYWTPKDVGNKPVYSTVEEAEKQLAFEPEYKAYFTS